MPWNDINNCETPDEMLVIWQNLFTTVADIHAPIRSKRVRNKKSPWLTSEIIKLTVSRDKLKRVAMIISRNPDHWTEFKTARNLVNNNIKEAKATYYRSEIDENFGNYKGLWKLLIS